VEITRSYVSRRTLLTTVIVGAAEAAVGCQRERQHAAPSAKPSAAPDPAPRARVNGENFSQPHSKRDGKQFPKVEVKESCEVAIIGGGPSGLYAAHLLKNRDVLLLEKEGRLGGNCSTDSWQGVQFSTGAAFFSEGDTELVELMREIGAPGLPIAGTDALIVKGEPYFDFFGAGAARLPFPDKVKSDFQRSAEHAQKLKQRHDSRELDARTFADVLREFVPEVKQFWDRYGASNWGAETEHTSARLGVHAYSWLIGVEKRLSYAGGLGVGALALGRWVESKLPGRLRLGSFVHQVELEPGKAGGVRVHALVNGEPHTIRARSVILAVPKFFAARIVQDLTSEQRLAMSAFRYAPYPVFNLCLNGRGPQPAYDNWFMDAPFADFIPADWVLHAGKAPSDAKSALTVYHPLPETRRSELLDDPRLVDMADDVVEHLNRHFPGVKKLAAEIRVFRRGHALAIPTPGQLDRAGLATRAHGRIFFAHSDSRGDVSSFPGALRAARSAVEALPRG